MRPDLPFWNGSSCYYHLHVPQPFHGLINRTIIGVAQRGYGNTARRSMRQQPTGQTTIEMTWTIVPPRNPYNAFTNQQHHAVALHSCRVLAANLKCQYLHQAQGLGLSLPPRPCGSRYVSVNSGWAFTAFHFSMLHHQIIRHKGRSRGRKEGPGTRNNYKEQSWHPASWHWKTASPTPNNVSHALFSTSSKTHYTHSFYHSTHHQTQNPPK